MRCALPIGITGQGFPKAPWEVVYSEQDWEACSGFLVDLHGKVFCLEDYWALD